ncbi:MAG TPA: tannase/feruloyl esterase family alpha/beta hydrolase, partial [Bryobacteraceae bacterium]|nr:tannase/feruloyl esterase family alpha/beta hydrolase [Bryobacteraceae bacterium]
MKWMVFLGTALPAVAQMKCEDLMAAKLAGVTVTSAVAVAAGKLEIPGGRGPTQAEVPAFCRVAGMVAPEVRFELWMPERWNRKLMAVGNGGLAGTIPTTPMLAPLRRGYATGSTDTGHQGASTNDGAWALGHYERVVDFADRGVHAMAQADKVILRAFYGGGPAHSYFNGCSQGGHEALIEAQRYPEDFDGIIAGDPANNWTRHYAGGHLWTGVAMEGDGYLPPAKVQLLGDAVNAQCDALDGVKDGVLNDPRRCRFEAASLECKGADEARCLTTAQVRAVEKVWAGLRDEHGDQIYPGIVPGGETGPGGWTNWVTGLTPGKSAHLNLGIPFFRYMVFEDANWDFRTFRFRGQDGFDSDADFTDGKLGALFNAVNPDLGAFRARGGKLIQYHGWSDPDITPLNSIDYYESVVRLNARGGNHGLRETKEFYRLFMVPGMQHCGGGPGATTFDMVGPLEEWVEGRKAPEMVVAAHVVAGVAEFTRPLCVYPAEAVWDKEGVVTEAG